MHMALNTLIWRIISNFEEGLVFVYNDKALSL